MASPAQKYRLNNLSSVTAEHLQQLDEMLEDIYTYLSQSPFGTSTAAFDFTALGLVTDGAVYVLDGSLFAVPQGTTGQLLRQGVAVPEWSAIIYPNALAVGDILYASTTTTLSRLADVATGNALISGGVNTAPLWGKVGLATHVSGTLPVANGGTGRVSDTAYAVITGGTTSTDPQQSVSGVGTLGQVLTSNGAGTLPTWQDSTGGGSHFEPVTNGIVATPEIVFSNGDVVMVEVF